MSDLIFSGINLMLTGMLTVFIFLAILIILINVAALILKDDIKKEENNINQNQISNNIPKTHLEIINYINKRIFNE
ncbi:MAG: OadG family protein [SAR86 cluster bacterium]|jgi:Na+-transporting methylmalonyl-CoA/oxaloacetate decarboxylase gamma subunit|uniref:OadG family protein n=1 Tax=SAR86 cluster bacterium TaxID=2030880 RepID=A0A937I8P3_9GAMM|nr:OadG family protein [SAR86 cluster bacterium]